MKHLKYILIVFLSLGCVTMAAQNSDALAEYLKLQKELEAAKAEIETLKSDQEKAVEKAVAVAEKAKDSEISKLQKEIDGLNKKIDKLNTDKDKAEKNKAQSDSLLKVEKNSGEKKQLNDRIEELENQIAEVKKNNIAENQKLSDQIYQLSEQHKEDLKTIADLEAQLENLSDIQAVYLADLSQNVDKDWLNKPYSQIDVNELEKALRNYRKFASQDQNVANAAAKLSDFYADCKIYKNGVDAVNSQYESVSVAKNLANVKSLLDRVKDPVKKGEVEVIYNQLNNYQSTIEIFQDVITAVDEQIKGKKHAMARPLAMARIKTLEEEDGYITPLKEIPWVAKQFDAYIKALEKDTAGPNPARDTIMRLVP